MRKLQALATTDLDRVIGGCGYGEDPDGGGQHNQRYGNLAHASHVNAAEVKAAAGLNYAGFKHGSGYGGSNHASTQPDPLDPGGRIRFAV